MAPSVATSILPVFQRHPRSHNVQVSVQPDLSTISDHLAQFSPDDAEAPNVVPLIASMPAEFLNPSSAYLKLSASKMGEKSFLLESASSRETIARYSFLGCGGWNRLVFGTF